jgi:predicted dehydrogenase
VRRTRDPDLARIRTVHAPYRTVLIGCGPRGRQHALGLRANGSRFALTAVCDLDPHRLASLADELAPIRRYTGAAAMLSAETPDVLCFATPCAVRLSLVELGVAHGVRAIALEKPLAASLTEARRIVDLCAAAGVKGVICHQLRHGAHWQRAKKIVEGGAIGDVRSVHATARPSMLRVGTHLVDCALWLTGAEQVHWVIGQAVGTTSYDDDHPGPDHLAGMAELDGAIRAVFEIGSLAPRELDEEGFWGDVAVTVLGTEGWVRVVLGAGWWASSRWSRGQVECGPADPSPQEARHLALLADWLDDPARTHPCDLTRSYHGLEALMGMALSAIEHRRVDLPITPVPHAILERLRAVLPDGPLTA